MDNQDWIPVVARRRYTKKEQNQNGNTIIQPRDSSKNERIHMAKLENSDIPIPKKRISADTLQTLIRKRIELKLTQEKADNLCAFPRNTFKELEAHRLIPNEEQKQRIYSNFNVQLKIATNA
jgi:hypothetical protein